MATVYIIDEEIKERAMQGKDSEEEIYNNLLYVKKVGILQIHNREIP